MTSKRYTLIMQDGEVRTRRRVKLFEDGGRTWALLEGGKYHVFGRWHHFYYRAWGSLGLRKRIGLQKIWLKGNPVPIFLSNLYKNDLLKNLQDTARGIYNITENDNPERLMRPRKVDILILVLVGFAAFAIGMALGGRV